MKRWQSIALGLFTILVLGVINFLVFQKERLLAEGQTIFLELGPVDPRSLMQGDLMPAELLDAAPPASRTPSSCRLAPKSP